MAAFIQRLRFAFIAASCLLAATLVMIHVRDGVSAPQQSTELLRKKTKFSCSYEGSVVPDGDRIDLYREPRVPFGEHCIYESRYCKVGILTAGFFNYRSCYVLRHD